MSAAVFPAHNLAESIIAAQFCVVVGRQSLLDPSDTLFAYTLPLRLFLTAWPLYLLFPFKQSRF